MLAKREEANYLNPHRLADVLALIQVLALDRDAHRSETGLKKEIQASPRSAASWNEVARDHPEFFRVNIETEAPVSLLARHVTERDPTTGKHPVLAGAHVDSLLRAAIEMHDRQVRRSERWTYLTPVLVALLAGFFTITAAILKV